MAITIAAARPLAICRRLAAVVSAHLQELGQISGRASAGLGRAMAMLRRIGGRAVGGRGTRGNPRGMAVGHEREWPRACPWEPSAAAWAPPTVDGARTLPAPPMTPWLARPRASADARLTRALISGYYARADAGMHAELVRLGWES